MTIRLQFRRGFASLWQSVNPLMEEGELGLEKDTNRFKFGDGIHLWNDLDYAVSRVDLKTTRLYITNFISGGSIFSVSGSGLNYTMSGDVGNLGTSYIYFNEAGNIQIYLNGMMQIKTEDVYWFSNTSFMLNQYVDNTDEIIILS